MCCLFGILDYKQSLNQKQLNKMVSILSKACEVRGTDATGISYNYNNKLCIFKRPLPAHRLHYKIPENVHHIMGHTRMTTQGNEKFNYNNHPFPGKADNINAPHRKDSYMKILVIEPLKEPYVSKITN